MAKIKPLYPQEQEIIDLLKENLSYWSDNDIPNTMIPQRMIDLLQECYAFYRSYRATDNFWIRADGEINDVQQLEVLPEDQDPISVVIIDQDIYTSIAPNTSNPNFDTVISGCDDFQEAIRLLIDRLGFHYEFFNEEGEQ